jgi:hypothetical protein
LLGFKGVLLNPGWDMRGLLSSPPLRGGDEEAHPSHALTLVPTYHD